MNCPRCNGKIVNAHKRCDYCGLDLSIYRKIFSLSNMYYNEGLKKAQVRDLSGAVIVLKKSLELNKRNTNARNLLGLIYYETGETVAALSAWVISKHFQEKDNDADFYMNSIQKNPSKLEAMNQTIKKYNIALQAAKNQNDDLAILQLKKVVTMNPRFVKALQLLALLQIKNHEIERAKKNLAKACRIDVSNTTTLLYIDYIEQLEKEAQPAPVHETKESEVRKIKSDTSRNFVSITPYHEDKPNLRAWLNLILGAVVGLLVGYFCFVPATRKSVIQDFHNSNNGANSQVSTQLAKIDSLESDKMNLEEKVQKLQEQLESIEIPEYDEKMYDNLFEAINLYLKELEKPEKDRNMLEIARNIEKVKTGSFKNTTAKDLHRVIKEQAYVSCAPALYEEGHNLYLAGKYQEALDTLLEAYKYDSKDASIIYFIGRSYQRLGENEKAKKYYDKIIKSFQDTERYNQAKSKLAEMGY